jgi:hypothetical protein
MIFKLKHFIWFSHRRIKQEVRSFSERRKDTAGRGIKVKKRKATF